jgi:hypothetical protein
VRLAQLDQDGGVAVEVRDREEARRCDREERVLRIEVLDAYGEQVTSRRRLVAEAREVGLGERSLPREALVADHPRAITPLRADRDARQASRERVDLVERHHREYQSVPSAVSMSWMPCAASSSRIAVLWRRIGGSVDTPGLCQTFVARVRR